MKRLFIVMVLVGLVGCGQQNLGGSSAQGSPVPAATATVQPTRRAPTATVQPTLPAATATVQPTLPAATATVEPTLPAATATVQATLPAATGVVGIIDGQYGFVLGGVQGGAWIDPLTAAASLTANQRYSLYSPVARIGEAIGAAPLPPEAEPCSTENPTVGLQTGPMTFTLALNADWEVFPRQSTEIPLDTPMYQDAVRDFLLTQGISNTEILLTRVVSVDLEGDGVNEVVINATQRLGENLTAVAGEYSLVLVQRMVQGKAVNISVVGDYYPQAKDWSSLYQYHLRSLADLNGDGDLEIFVDTGAYEGFGMSIHEINGNESKKVLIGGCESF